ncbi:MAG: beta-ketoacyl-ACP synthase II [Candidatus Hydrogenedentota bacterium]
MDTKVVITGMGVVSPVGNTVDAFWDSLCNGRSGIGPITNFDATDFKTRIAGEVGEIVPEGFSTKDLSRQDDYSIYAIEAADQAWRDSGLESMGDKLDRDRCGCIIGSGIGGITTIQHEVIRLHEGGPRRISPLMIPKGVANLGSGNVAIRLRLRGPNKCIVSACASSNHCIGEGADIIRLGRADVVVAGGAEAAICGVGIGGFAAMRATSNRNDEPERASRPFDADRNGFVMAEGAGILILESETHAKARGANIIAEVGALGESCDAFHMTAPLADGSGGAKAMQSALDESRIDAGDVTYFNAHGTSTQLNEPGETKALNTVFGEEMPLVTSTKSMTGHLLGAASAIEGISCVLSIRDSIIPPTINYETPDPECMVNLVANEARESAVEIAMSNSLGFGGHNATLIVKKYHG